MKRSPLYTYPAAILSGSRGDQWKAVLGTNILPILSPALTQCSLDPSDRNGACFMLDVQALTDGQRQALTGFLAGKFAASYDQVQNDLSFIGVPIRDGADVRISTPADWKPRSVEELPIEVFDPRLL